MIDARMDAKMDAKRGSPKALHVENLVMVRGTKPVTQAIELFVERGRITALLGPNGAGKSSTVLGIAGVIEPAFGEILARFRVGNCDLRTSADEKARQTRGRAALP